MLGSKNVKIEGSRKIQHFKPGFHARTGNARRGVAEKEENLRNSTGRKKIP